MKYSDWLHYSLTDNARSEKWAGVWAWVTGAMEGGGACVTVDITSDVLTTQTILQRCNPTRGRRVVTRWSNHLICYKSKHCLKMVPFCIANTDWSVSNKSWFESTHIHPSYQHSRRNRPARKTWGNTSLLCYTWTDLTSHNWSSALKQEHFLLLSLYCADDVTVQELVWPQFCETQQVYLHLNCLHSRW